MFRLTTINLDAPDIRVLADFYKQLLRWEIQFEEQDWIKLISPDGSIGISFQTEPRYVPPVWPSEADAQQMQIHLDIQVEDLDEAVRRAESYGARLADHQPQDDVRVMLDPAGHPFCLWVAT